MVDLQAGSGNLKAPHSLPIFGMYALPNIPTVQAVFKDAAWREQCVVDTTWKVYVTESSESLSINF